MTTHHPYAILGAKIATPGWTGTPMTLAYHDSASMPQTPNGSTVLAWQNTGTQNSDGTLAVTSGGARRISGRAGAGQSAEHPGAELEGQ